MYHSTETETFRHPFHHLFVTDKKHVNSWPCPTHAKNGWAPVFCKHHQTSVLLPSQSHSFTLLASSASVYSHLNGSLVGSASPSGIGVAIMILWILFRGLLSSCALSAECQRAAAVNTDGSMALWSLPYVALRVFLSFFFAVHSISHPASAFLLRHSGQSGIG